MPYFYIKESNIVEAQLDHMKAFVRTQGRNFDGSGKTENKIDPEYLAIEGSDNSNLDGDYDDDDRGSDEYQDFIYEMDKKLIIAKIDDSDSIYDENKGRNSSINGSHIYSRHVPILVSDLVSEASIENWLEKFVAQATLNHMKRRAKGPLMSAPLIIYTDTLQGKAFDKADYDLSELFESRYYEDEEDHVFIKIGSNTYVTTLDSKYYNRIDVIEVSLGESIEEKWQETLTKRFEKEYEQAVRSVEEAKVELLKQTANLGEKRFLKDSINEGVKDKVQKNINNLNSLTDATVKFYDNFFKVTTEDFWISHDKTKRFVGKFMIKVSYTGKVYIQNLKLVNGSKMHPHTFGDTDFCLGGYDTAMSNCLSQYDFYSLVLTIMEFLRTVNPSDSVAVSNLRKHFPESIQEGTVFKKSPIVEIF